MSTAPFKFPSPIGGVPFDLDHTPSIVFAVVYAVAILVSFYRLFRSRSLTVLVIGTFSFMIERYVHSIVFVHTTQSLKPGVPC